MRIRESSAMLGYPCLARQQLSLLALLVTSIVTLIAKVTEAQDYRVPQIFTYGDPCETHQNLPYQVQTSLPTSLLPRPQLPPEKTLGYDIRGPTNQWNPPNIGFKLPIGIQEPLQFPGHDSHGRADPLRGKTYGIDIKSGPFSGPQQPSLGRFDFGIQNPIPGPQQTGPQEDPSNRLRIQIQPVGGPANGPSLGPLPIGIEHPIYSPDQHGPANPPKLTGLTSQVDRLVIPACDLMGNPMGGGPASSPYAGSSSNIHGPFIPSYGLSKYPLGYPSGSISSGACR